MVVYTLIKVMNYSTLLTYDGVYTYNSYEILLACFFLTRDPCLLCFCCCYSYRRANA